MGEVTPPAKMPDVEVKSLNVSEGERVFLYGSVRHEVCVGRDVIGRGLYRPGWRWSEHVRPQTGSDSGDEPCVALDFVK